MEEEKSSGLVRAVKCDLCKEEDILSMFSAIKSEFGGVDVCINNAGLAHVAPLSSGETEKFRSMLEVCFYFIIKFYFIIVNFFVACLQL